MVLALSSEAINLSGNLAGNLTRGRPKTFDRGHVLEVAMLSYWSHGPNNISLNAICKRAGVSKPGLYREFGSEDGLKQAVLIAYHKMGFIPLQAILEADQPFDQTIDAVIAYLLQDRVAAGLPQGCLYVDMCQCRDQFGTQTKATLDVLRQQVLECYADWLERAKAKGHLKADVVTKTAALYVDLTIAAAMKLHKQGEPTHVREDLLRLGFSVFF